MRIGCFAESHEGGGIGDDDSRVAETDEGDEEADAGGSAVFEAIRNAIDDVLTHFGEREEQKEEPGEEDDAEGGLPGHAAAKNDGVCEVGIEGHARREGDGVVGPQTHDQRGDRGRNASGEENAVNGHATFREDARVDDDHVGHGHEGGQPREQFAADGGLVFLQVKDAVEQTVFP